MQPESLEVEPSWKAAAPSQLLCWGAGRILCALFWLVRSRRNDAASGNDGRLSSNAAAQGRPRRGVEECWRDVAPGKTVALVYPDDPGVWHEARDEYSEFVACVSRSGPSHAVLFLRDGDMRVYFRRFAECPSSTAFRDLFFLVVIAKVSGNGWWSVVEI